ncbi:MAG: pyridoxamine 5'-phosphate oxidase family protein [Chitinophagaceae bacterium]
MFCGNDFLFLKEKIYDLDTALFISKSEAVLKVPTCIISVLKVDDTGQLWFLIPRPKQYVNEFEKSFVSEMDFYRKGKDYYLIIEGKAYIINDPEDINNLMDLPEEVKYQAMHERVLIKLRIKHINYYESRKSTASHGLNTVKDKFNQLIFNQRPGFRPYRLQTDNLA